MRPHKVVGEKHKFTGSPGPLDFLRGTRFRANLKGLKIIGLQGLYKDDIGI